MIENSLLVAAHVSLSSQHVYINMRERKLACAAMRMVCLTRPVCCVEAVSERRYRVQTT